MNENEPIIEAKLVPTKTDGSAKANDANERDKLITRDEPNERDEPRYVQPSSGKKFLDNKWAVLAVLFSVTGFLGLPLLWTNKDFSNFERIFWAIVVTIYTVLLIAGAVAVCIWSYRKINGAW